jgi:biopolymer transport protein ExbD
MPRSELAFGEPPRRRRPSLTPMIDVVFLLLVFFMLAAGFGLDNAIPLSPAFAGGGTWEGAPRLVEVAPGTVRLNGTALDPEALAPELRALMPDEAAPVVLRPVGDASLQNVVAVLDRLGAAGIRNVVLAE